MEDIKYLFNVVWNYNLKLDWFKFEVLFYVTCPNIN